MTIKLVVADSHPLFLLGLAQLLRSEPGFKLLATCATAEETINAVWKERPDILIVAINLPDRNGLELIKELKNSSLEIKVVILAAAIDENQTIHALCYGVKGVVLKDIPSHLLLQCLQKVAAGGMWMEKESMVHAFEKMLHREAGMRRLATILTARETEVMRCAASGLSNQQIAEQLIVREGTVKVHVHNIYRKLGFTNRVDLTLYAQKRCLL
ncbi:MAG: response regulator transcription factor [Desulfuromonadales bacterium]|nr:response regulator transcription factor [Desulfuromonadales bacterium]MDH3959880.1 response regulator transcription factor [Desulfuromonadales bacterium]MDH4026515.1 response regulator transcription factor [Desulfuromonadales bacterium]